MLKSLKHWTSYFYSNKNSRLIMMVTIGMFIIITITGYSLYFSSKSVLQAEVSEPQIHLLRIGMEAVNNSVTAADQIGVNILLSNLTYSFLNPDYEMKQVELTHLIEYLDNLTVSPLVESVLLFDKTRQRIVGSTPYGYSSSLSNLADQDWQNYTANMSTNRFTIVDRNKNLLGFEQKIQTITLFRPVVRDNEITGIIMVNINKKKLFDKIFENYTSQTAASRFVIDGSNHIVYEANNSILPQDRIAVALAQEQRNYFDYTDGKERYLISQITSDITGWKFVSVITQQRLLQQVTLIRNIVFGLSLTSILAGVIGIMVTHYVTFKPVRRIRHLILANQAGPHNLDHRELEDYFQKLTADLSHVSSIVKHNRGELHAKYIQDLIAGRMNAWEMQDRWHRHFTDWTDLPMFTILISIDNYHQWASPYNDEDQNLLWFAIKNIGLEWMGSRWKIALVERDQDLLLIVQKNSDNQDLQHLREDLAELMQTIHNLLRTEVSAAVGSEFYSYTELRNSYLQAELALSYRLYSGYSQINVFSEIAEGTDIPSIEGQWKQDLLKCLEGSNVEIATKLLTTLQDNVIRAIVHPAQVLSFFQQLMDSLNAHFTDNGLAKPNVLRRYNSFWFKTMKLDDMIALFIQVYQEASQLLNPHMRSRDFLVVQQMIQYMKLHLHENIGVPEIAESVGLSKSSVNTIFKQEMSRTLYDYLTELRMQETETNLAETDLKIAEIALKVGYQNENSLIRAFRKHRSMTPGQFREIAKKAAATETTELIQ
ncbi:helix-turn-helix domain-containing protein [Paenibacillus agricola]|uniref:AraC family transcriptional regulator n=1 Tax=Paenibacillus agricola TaxID=2716264 RepID=A0ABX0IZR8_9BACL|nr:helix-turn-helix domain-containing protein [Paenibacillus agricola]NHN29480.1 AraC family transcriptional regulator [Paenibacillus agricola]